MHCACRIGKGRTDHGTERATIAPGVACEARGRSGQGKWGTPGRRIPGDTSTMNARSRVGRLSLHLLRHLERIMGSLLYLVKSSLEPKGDLKSGADWPGHAGVIRTREKN